MRLLDLFCCQGGAAAGYHRAGFDVVGVDLAPQPRFPFEFVQADALAYVAEHGHEFDAVHASPPCQAYSLAWKIQGREHPDLLGPTRDVLDLLDLPYIIENVPGAPMRADAELCGAMFGLHTYRHRLFESNIPLVAPAHPEHAAPLVKMGRPLVAGDWYMAVGNFSNVSYVRTDMGVPWMNRDGIRESIPPAYTEYLGAQLLAHVSAERAA